MTSHTRERRLSSPVVSGLLCCAVVCVAVACGRSDVDLRWAVTGALAADPATAMLELDVTVDRGVVRLSGETTTRAEESRAIEVSRGVPGVKDIVADMRLSDVGVADTVRRLLRSDPLVRDTPIEVDVRRGVVSLRSDATNKAERDRAVQLAGQADGVTRVDDRMR